MRKIMYLMTDPKDLIHSGDDESPTDIIYF